VKKHLSYGALGCFSCMAATNMHDSESYMSCSLSTATDGGGDSPRPETGKMPIRIDISLSTATGCALHVAGRNDAGQRRGCFIINPHRETRRSRDAVLCMVCNLPDPQETLPFSSIDTMRPFYQTAIDGTSHVEYPDPYQPSWAR
jgi:hypothetical protein